MKSLSAPDSGGNGGRTPAVTLNDVRIWEYELMEALRDARHYIDWGTGSVDDEDPPPMLKFKMEAHGAITGAEGSIEKILDALKDVLRARTWAEVRPHANVTPERGAHARLEALAAEARHVEATAARMLELLAGCGPRADVAARTDTPERP